MKKVWIGILTVVTVLAVGTVSTFAAGPGQGRFAGTGICNGTGVSLSGRGLGRRLRGLRGRQVRLRRRPAWLGVTGQQKKKKERTAFYALSAPYFLMRVL